MKGLFKMIGFQGKQMNSRKTKTAKKLTQQKAIKSQKLNDFWQSL